MNYWLLVLLQLLPIGLCIYLYLQKKWTYWSSRGVPGPPPSILQLGNTLDRLLKSPAIFELEQLQQYGKICGRYRGIRPVLTVLDAELIKQIMIKDFGIFMNKKALNTYDELWNGALFNAESDRWKRIRTITSPTFTAGKLKGMQQMMNRCVSRLLEHLEELSTESGIMVPKNVLSGFTIDVIASTVFATEVDANKKNAHLENAVVANGLALFRMKPLRVLCFLVLPRVINDLLGVRHQFAEEHFSFFANLTKEIVKRRREGGGPRRNDLVQLLIDAYVFEEELKSEDWSKLAASMEKEDESGKSTASNQSKKSFLTDSEIIAQAIIIFIAGFETTANTLVHCLYEMSQHVTIQDRLAEELHRVLSGLALNSDAYYEAVMTQQIPLLDAVIKETLRKYPPVVRLDRRVGIDGYQLGGIPLCKDTTIEVSTYAVHHCPDYYPEPDRFNPERFMPENRDSLVPYTFLPFGIGPRNCIGMRFAYQEIKLCLAQVLSRFRFSPTAKTPTVLQYNHATLLLNSYPFEVQVSKRECC